MGQLFRFSSKHTNSKKSRNTTAVRPVYGLRYDEQLVDKLQQEHNKLLMIYDHIQGGVIEGDLPAIDRLLNEFRTEFQTHLLSENIRLYAFLKEKYADDPNNNQLIHDLREEMYMIGHVVMAFLRKYRKTPLDGKTLTLFKNELNEVGEVLLARFQLEESQLYPLYTR